MFCHKCGASNADEDTFCAECGVRLPKEAHPRQPEPTAPVPKVQQQPPAQPPKTEARWGFVAVIMIVGVAIGIYLVGHYSDPCSRCSWDEDCIDGVCVPWQYNPCDYCLMNEECIDGMCVPVDDYTPEPTVLFSDDFSGGFSSANWVAMGAPPEVDWSVGSGAPSLRFLALDWYTDPTERAPADTVDGAGMVNPGGPMAAGTWDPIRTAVNPFTTDTGLGAQMAVRVPESKDAGTLTFQIRGQSSHSPAAMVKYYGYTKRITFTIALPNGASSETAFPLDREFHTVAFIVDGLGNAWWLLDDVVQLSSAGFPNDYYVVEIGGSPSKVYERPAGAERTYFHVDNVMVVSLNSYTY